MGFNSYTLANAGFITFGGGGMPDTPVNIGVSTISTTVLLVSWDFTQGAYGFDLYRSLSLSGTFTKINSTTILTTSFYDGQMSPALSGGTDYYYKVKAIGEPSPDNDSPFSGIAKGTTLTESQAGKTYYYPETIRNVTVALLDMFNDFTIKRYEKTPTRQANVVKIVKVPIMFGQPGKRHLDELRDGTKGFQAPPLPRMNLFLNGIEYDASRASGLNETMNFYNQLLQIQNQDQFFTEINPAPYNYNFTLSIQTDNLNDFSQITENILPYFNPMRYLRVKEFAFLNIERDLPVRMTTFVQNFNDNLEVDAKREVNADINLNVEGWMYRPITFAKIIKYITSNYITSEFDIGGDINNITLSTFNTSISGTTKTSFE